jgi:hypothetical protein
LQNAFADVQVEEEEEEIRRSVTGSWLAGRVAGIISEGADGPNPGGVGWDSVVTYKLSIASLWNGTSYKTTN